MLAIVIGPKTVAQLGGRTAHRFLFFGVIFEEIGMPGKKKYIQVLKKYIHIEFERSEKGNLFWENKKKKVKIENRNNAGITLASYTTAKNIKFFVH